MMTKWKKNKLLKAEKIALKKVDRESNNTSYIGNVFQKIRNQITKIIKKFRK